MSYRSYVPWKTNLPLYKSSSTYSSRDDITGSDGKPIPKFGSITSPAAYRPSYSGGTYRSVPIKRDPPLSTYVSRYSSNTIDSSSQSKDDKNKVTDTITKKIQKPTTVSSATKYTPLSTTKEVNETPSTPSSSRLSTPSGNLSRYSRSRDPSPSVENRSRLLTPSKVKSREPSPARSTLRARSRDPSPADITLRSKLTSPVNSYGSSYRLCPRSSSGYSSRYGSNNSLGRSPIANGALSYMSSSDMRARSINQQQEHIENESLQQNKDIKEEEFSKSETEETEEEEDNSNDSKATIPVTVVTRGTSPTPPGSSSVTRTRRIDIAKTIEKTIQRPVKKHKCIDKEIQSDRLDDSTRYSRFGATSRVSSIPWTPYTDSKLTSNLRYSSSSSKTSRDSTSTSKSEQDSNERKKDDSGSAISRNSSFRSSTKKEKSKNKNTITSSTTSSTGSAEVYQIPGPKTLPPTIPKTESPSKTISSSSGNLKLPNKDFRKSSLNVGPTDRPRKSRTPSTSTDSEEKNEQTTQNVVQTNERSPSVGSETSATSSSSSSANNASKRCHQPKIRTSSSNISTQMKSFSEDTSSIAVTNEASINSSGIGNSSSKFYNKNDRDIVNIRNKQLYQQQISPKYQQTSSKQHVSTATNSNSQAGDSSNASKNEGAKTYLLRKLGSVSNFFVTRSQDTSGELIYLDKSSSSNSTSNDLKQNGTIATTTASEQFIPVTTVSQTNNSKTETSELDDSSWWLNTSQQIDTESALDIKDEMKFKIRHIDSGEIAWWMRNDDEDETVAEDIKTYAQDERSEFADNSQNTENLISPDQSWWTNENESKSEKYKIRRNDSGEQAWWLNDNETPSISTNSREQLPRVSTDTNDKQKQQQIESINQRNSSNENNSKNRSQDETTIDDSIWSRKSSPDKKQNSFDSRTKIYRVDSGEKPWWMNNEGDDETFVTNYDSHSKKENSQSPEKKNTSFAKIHRVDSSEKPWWLTEDNSNNENYSENTETHQNSDRTQNQYNLRHTPSDDKPWWMAGPTKKNFQIRHIDSGEKAWWLQDDSSEKADNKNCEKSEDSEVENVITGNLSNSKTTENEDSLRPPLGDRASPEGLEDPSAKGRKSPYDNCLTAAKKLSSSSPLKNTASSLNNDKQQNTQNLKKLFISRHTNIDELLGGSCRPLSPILDRFTGKNKFLEEITPAQVRIHDSTAQMPVIQRMERDNWASENISVPSTSSSVQQQKQKSSAFTYELDDAALQVYKDGDFGAYLDLESSLAEQSEDIEGLNSSRKNSLVVRTQLSVRVHAIIEKLLSSEGSELRRALFSLKQIFQEDKDLVHGFVALGGLNCLVRVGNVADQNYQNYILRALGQVMLYVDGMNGVMKHGPTIQWLYSLIASKYRLVVKTALKLLLVFVEYVESNCYLLVNAIHTVDNSQGTLPWSNIMKLLKDYENADTELLIYATSLINKTLSGLSDQDSFYDESDFLEQQGMEGVIQRYMSRPGTDLDLLDQLQLYEAVLKFEDGETDGIRLPDNSVRKTLRYRPSTDSAERRKSRRHSTGTSPQIQSQTQNSASSPTKRYTPLANQGVLDEDSSSSNNSNEFSGGVFRECKGKREGAGVTPGLRRRRERAERQKTFMKEQQEALANGGIKSPFDRKDELNGLGQIVTAIPVHLKNCADSPPDSLILSSTNDHSSSVNHKSNHESSSISSCSSSSCSSSSVSDTSSTMSDRSSFSSSSSPLTITSISVLSNGFADRKNSNLNGSHKLNSNNNTTSGNNSNNNIGNGGMLNERATPTIIHETIENSNTNTTAQDKWNDNASPQTPPEFISNKTFMMRTNNNTTVINGLKKNLNISRNDMKILKNGNSNTNNNNNNSFEMSTENSLNNNNNCINGSSNSHRIFENESNRLNNFYSQIASGTPTKITATANTPIKNSILNQKNLNSVSVNKIQHQQQQQQLSSLQNGRIMESGITNGHMKNSTINNTNSCSRLQNGCVNVKQKDTESSSNNVTGGSGISSGVGGCVTPLAINKIRLCQNINTVTSNSSMHISNGNKNCSINSNSTSNEISSSVPKISSAISTEKVAAEKITIPTIQIPPPPPPLLLLSSSSSSTQMTPTASITSVNVSNNGNIIQGNNTNNNTMGNILIPDILIESDNEDKKLLLQLKRDHTVKDLTQKLTNLPPSPQEDKSQNRIGDMTGLISKAKEGLAKSKSKGEISRSPSVDQDIKKSETKKSENEVHWEELVKNISRPLTLCDLDFTDLNSDDEKDVLAPRGLGGNIPPPPPPIIGMPPPPMMISGMMYPPTSSSNLPPPPTNLVPPPAFNYGSMNNSSTLPRLNNSTATTTDTTIKKNKKTVKLFWKEVREDMIPPSIGKTIWDELPSTNVDIQKLEHLFESRAKDLMTKKQQEMNKNKEIIVLDHKRSNAINIAMTKLPPPRAIKAAILKMDATVVTREGIDKLLNMLPTEEERGKIQEAQMSNPELPLGSAEQFLLTLSSISELAARLKLWAFKLDFENSEREIAEPLMDLKQGIELLRVNKTFKCILATLLSVGIFLNGIPVKGFQIEYLAKVPEVKDTVHKHSLLHHLCHMVMESSPDTTDLYSEIGPITRASKADFTELAHNLIQLETECKASWDRLKLIAKHDCPPQLKQKLVDFLADCAERIIILQIVHRRVINRYRKFLLWLGVPQHRVAESKPNEFCRILSEFALEYRTTRERVHQQMEKKANHRERNKTRGKMIIDIGKFRTQEDRADAELKQLLGSPNPGTQSPDGTLTWRRRRADNLRSPLIKPNADENFTDGDDEILESLVKTATKAPGTRTTPRERKRTRHADRKSLRRTLKNGLTEEEKQQVASLIKTY